MQNLNETGEMISNDSEGIPKVSNHYAAGIPYWFWLGPKASSGFQKGKNTALVKGIHSLLKNIETVNMQWGEYSMRNIWDKINPLLRFHDNERGFQPALKSALTWQSRHGLNALMVACSGQTNPDALKEFIKIFERVYPGAVATALTQQSKDGRNALMVACSCQTNPDALQKFIELLWRIHPDELKTALTQKNQYGWNALMIACIFQTDLGALQGFVKTFGRIYPDTLKIALTRQMKSGQIILMFVCAWEKNFGALKGLIEFLARVCPDALKAALMQEDKYGRNFLTFACKCQSSSIRSEIFSIIASNFPDEFERLWEELFMRLSKEGLPYNMSVHYEIESSESMSGVDVFDVDVWAINDAREISLKHLRLEEATFFVTPPVNTIAALRRFCESYESAARVDFFTKKHHQAAVSETLRYLESRSPSLEQARNFLVQCIVASELPLALSGSIADLLSKLNSQILSPPLAISETDSDDLNSTHGLGSNSG